MYVSFPESPGMVCHGLLPEHAGMVMERINGLSVDKVITARNFHDIHYIRDMLLQVFTALDAAQRAFGCVICPLHCPLLPPPPSRGTPAMHAIVWHWIGERPAGSVAEHSAHPFAAVTLLAVTILRFK